MESQQEIKKFSEVYPQAVKFENAEQIEFKDVLGKEIIIEDISEMIGEFGEFIIVLAELNKNKIQFALGSTVVIPKLKKAKTEGKLPLIATILEKKSEKTKRRYFSIE